MKTAIEELIEKVNAMKSESINVVKIYIYEAREKEKQQIIDAYDNGTIDGFDISSEDYYNQKFKKP